MEYRIGIDAGSKTVKIAVLDERSQVVYSAYKRHGADIHATLKSLLHDMQWHTGGFNGPVAVTGSAGIEVARMMDLPFVQEVVATTRAVSTLVPAANAFIELGGEDAKVVYLTGGLEQRMNATCAGGTGGFIDTMAFMLGVRASGMNSLALGANHRYPIASRCAVFAQTDVRPLLNSGARKADIAGSVFDAVVSQTLGGLACGRPLEGTVVFLGGPLEFNSELVARFRTALDLDRDHAIKPKDAHLYTAFGAALSAPDCEHPVIASTAHLESVLDDVRPMAADFQRLPRLFETADDLEAFKTRHRACRMPRNRLDDARGPVYLGMDAGSTAVKLVLLDEDDALVYRDYRPLRGDVLRTATEMLERLYRALPHAYGDPGNPYVHIAGSAVTGYGEDMLRCAFGIDGDVVETAAHLRAAQLLVPDVSFVLDIGGQDIKALWIRNGEIDDAVLNEACSSGCGAFIESTAHALSCTPTMFSDAAVQAENPLDLGMKCTVFTTSRVRHAQKIGADRKDIAAGLAYSVIQNALFRVVRVKDFEKLGGSIVVQGGTFLSDAVLRAFELTVGTQVVRPDTAELSGAIGAALAAHERGDDEGGSSLIDARQLDRFAYRQRSDRCPGCRNRCPVNIVSFGSKALDASANVIAPDALDPSSEQRAFITGNRCTRAYAFFGEKSEAVRRSSPPNLYRMEQRLLARFIAEEPPCAPRLRIGMPRTLHLYENTPFWHTLLVQLGFDVRMPAIGDAAPASAAAQSKMRGRGLETVFSESVCYPAKLTHLQVADLLDAQVDAVFMPHLARGTRCPVSSLYAVAVRDSVPAFATGGCGFASPQLKGIRPRDIARDAEDRAAVLASLNALLAEDDAIEQAEFDEALEAALREQERFAATLAAATRTALHWMEVHDGRGIVLAGRPYHVDSQICHGIDRMIADEGCAVLSPAGIDALDDDERAGADAIRARMRRSDWAPAKTLAKLAAFTCANPRLQMVCLYSFGCGYDAVTLDEVHDLLEAEGRPFCSLKIDEIADLAHVRIRLRTFDEMVRLRNRGAQRVPSVPRAIGTLQRTASGNGTEDIRGIDDADLDCARACINDDVCLVASALSAACIERGRRADAPSALRLPRVCESCLVDASEVLARRAGTPLPEIEWVDRWLGDTGAGNGIREPGDAGGAHAACEPDGASDPERPRIGVLGNALFCFDTCANRAIGAYLREHGCAPVFPDAGALFADDVGYTDQIAAFARKGVDHIIYLQAFGCLKGHVQTRGALRRLHRDFPDLHLTIIDYDANASLLNQENRILLAIDAARHPER